MADVLRSQILLVDDHPLFRAGLALALAREPDLQIAGEASTASEAIDIVRHVPIDVAVIDVLMPTTSGISLASQLSEIQPQLKCLGLSVLEEPSIIGSMLRAGATGYALKTQPPEEVTEAIRAVLTGERYIPPCVPRTAVMSLLEGDGAQTLHRLTRREREIFDLLIRGYSNDEIGSRLFIARRTVETHRQHIMKKLDTHSLLDMIRVAARQGALSR
jgi:DNA-binding NarL/FixJ family response regulator